MNDERPIRHVVDGPAAVEPPREYWIESLRAAPCGRWEIPDFGR